MIQNLKHSHINERFISRFGREFNARDKRLILKMVAYGKASIRVSKSDRNKFCVYCVYEDKPMIFIIAKDNTFVTCFDANSSLRRM